MQYVYIKGSSSSAIPVISGCPEGSVTGPIFYICYSLDMYLEIIYSTLSTFADVSKIYKCIANVRDQLQLQSDFDNIINIIRGNLILMPQRQKFCNWQNQM